MITLIVTFVVGAIVGALVARNNIKKLNTLVAEAKELANAAEKELIELQAKVAKKPAGRKPRTRKTTTKKK
jgi:tetrahydromethanopterin S-methyltransferase subunit C